MQNLEDERGGLVRSTPQTPLSGPRGGIIPSFPIPVVERAARARTEASENNVSPVENYVHMARRKVEVELAFKPVNPEAILRPGIGHPSGRNGSTGDHSD